MQIDGSEAQRSPRSAWLSAALICAALLVLPAIAWILTPRPGGFAPPPAQRSVHAETHEPLAAPTSQPRNAEPASQKKKPAPPPAEADPGEGPVSGVVLDPDGNAAKKASIGCDDRDKELTTTTDEEGRFKLPGQAAGCLAIAHHRDHSPSERVRLVAGRENTIRLSRGGAIDGVVVDEIGKPISPYLLAIESFVGKGDAEGPPPNGQARTIQDANGKFLLENLAPGRYVLTASASMRPPARSGSIEVEGGRTTYHVRIVLAKGATLSGKVTDADTRKPVAGALVALDAMTATSANGIAPARTDDAGAYTLEGVPAGPFSIRVAHDRYRTKIVPGLTTRGAPAIQQDVELQPRGDGGAGDSELAGIGAVLIPRPKGVAISWVLEPGPAASAGLRAGDLIATIDGLDVKGLPMSDCVQRLRGPEGSRVTVSVIREGAGAIEVTMTRKIVVRN